MFCKHCGKKIKETDNYCDNCGNYVGLKHMGKQEHKKKFVYELAYIGFGFFIPLIMGDDKVKAKRIANQGLWILIMSFIACTFIKMLGIVNTMLDGTVIFAISNPIYSFAFIIFLCFMLYLAYRCICNAKAIHHNTEVDNILFFDQIKIIK